MPQQNIQDLVDAWLKDPADSDLRYDLVQGEPENAWQAILELLKRDLTEEQTSLLAAGLVEDLIVYHGATFIDRIETEAKQNPKFNYLLGGVWRQGMDFEIWKRVENSRAQHW